MKDLSILIPVFNEHHPTIGKIVRALRNTGAEVIVIDDGSDEPLKGSIMHGFNAGYGGALLTGMRNSTRPLILTMDGDGQHSVREAIKLYKAFKMIGCDMLIGSRRLKYEKWHRILGRKVLNFIASVFARVYFQDLNSGMRIFKKDIAYGYHSILCRSFSFTTSLTMAMITDRYKVESFPIEVHERPFGESKVRVFKHGLITLWYIVWIGFALRTRKIRALLRKHKLWWILTGKGQEYASRPTSR